MITINKEIQNEIMMFTMEDLVPEDSLLRKIDKYIDFTFINEEVRDLYCSNNGRPSIEPAILFKIVFIQYLYGIKSMRETCKRINTDAEYRWFLNIPFGQKTPHFSTFSKNYERRFKDDDIFEKIFVKIVKQAIDYMLVDGSSLFTDSTHKKANANKRNYDEYLEEVAVKRRKWLEDEINEERRIQNKKEFIYKDKTETKTVKINRTDKESGYYHRSNKENGFVYLDHRTVDGKNNIIVDCHITKGNVHDSTVYIQRMKYIKNTFNFNIQKAALDSGYESLDIKHWLNKQNIFAVIGYRRHGTKESREKRKKFYYEAELDIYVHKETGEVLEYHGNIDRLGYKKYVNIDKSLEITRHLKEDLNEMFTENRISEEGKELYQERKITVERSFADSKCNHGFRFAMYKGVDKNQDYTWLSCAAQNMKNIALKVDRLEKKYQDTPVLTDIFKYFGKFTEFIKILILIKPLAFKTRGLSTLC